ncbi:diacylglycerol lipase-beta isoform 3-T3 [Vipera latastei]
MPGLVFFGRRWVIGSDDFVFPGAFELFIRVIWWIGILVLYSIHKGQFNCTGSGLLNNYLLILLILLAFIIAALSSVTYTSMQGTISNPGPRKSLPKLLYVRLALYVPELVWAVVGTVWIANNQANCERAMIDAILGTVIVSWVIIVFTVVAVFIFFDPLGRKSVYLADHASRNLESSQSEQLFFNIKKRATRVWEKRIRLLCCCIVQNDDHRVAFTSIAELLRSYFSDTDLVPSDIAAGLTLLHQEQDKVEHSKDPDEVLTQPPLPPAADDLEAELENAAHYMKFAAAAYGWPYYLLMNPFTGLCKLRGFCCRNSAAQTEIIGRDYLNMHFGSILQITGLQNRDFIHISFHNKIFEIPFFVALDHQKEAIVVAVRGTLSCEDVLTDLSADCESLTLEDVLENGLVHKAANYIYRRLINDGILNQALSIAPVSCGIWDSTCLWVGLWGFLPFSLLVLSSPGIQIGGRWPQLGRGRCLHLVYHAQELFSQPEVLRFFSTWRFIEQIPCGLHKAVYCVSHCGKGHHSQIKYAQFGRPEKEDH